MSFTLSVGEAHKVTFHVRYQGKGVPNDLHILLQDPKNPGREHARDLIAYLTIPSGMDPLQGIDIPYFPSSFPTVGGRLAPGIYTFLLVWSFGGERPDELDPDTPSLTETGNAEPPKEWSWWQLLAKVLGGAGGSAISGGLLNWWMVVAIVPCIITGGIGGAVGGAIGYLLSWLWDAPKIRWDLKSTLLFTLFFSLAFSMLFGLLALGPEQQAAAQGESFNRVTLGVSLVSGLLAAMLSGVLNNLRVEA